MNLGLSNVGLQTDSKGQIPVNNCFQTAVPRFVSVLRLSVLSTGVFPCTFVFV